MTLLVEKHTKEGAFIRIPAGQQVVAPLRIKIESKKNNAVYNVRNTIFVAAGAEVVVVEEYHSTQEHYTTHALTEIHLEKNAKIEFVKFQQENNSATHLSSVMIHQAQDSSARVFTLTTGSKNSRENLSINQYGKGAECELFGLFFLKDNEQSAEQFLQVNHFAEQTTSRMLYKGVLDNKTKATFNGKVYVSPDVSRINATQANHTILLSKTAEIVSQPELEIYANDVKCAHGATVGQLDNDALFYLQSRGIDRTMARNLLLKAFTDEVCQQIRNTALKEEIQFRVKRYVEL